MTVRRHTFEGATVGGNITGAESGSGDPLAFITAGAGSAVQGDSTLFMHGTKSAKIIPAAGVATQLAWTGLSSLAMAARGYFYYTALPSADFYQIRSHNGSGSRVWAVLINSAGKLRLSDTTGSTGIWTATNNFPLSSWVRIDVWGAVNTTTASSGSLKCAYYLGDSATPVSGGDSTAALSLGSQNLGTAVQVQAVFGKWDTSPYATPYWMDDIAIDDAAGGYLSIGSAPVVTAGATQTVSTSTGFSLPFTAFDAEGDPLTFVASADVSNPTSLGTLSVSGTGTNKVVTGTSPGTPGKYLVNVKANDGSSDSNVVQLTLYVTSTTSGATAVTGPTNWTSSTGSIAGCLNDSNQATYAQSPANPASEGLVVRHSPFPLGATAVLSYEFSCDVASPPRSMTVTLLMGATNIAAKTESTITTSVVAGSLTLNSGQLANWTDRNNPDIQYTAN